MKRNLNKMNIGAKRKSRKERASIAAYNEGIKKEVIEMKLLNIPKPDKGTEII